MNPLFSLLLTSLHITFLLSTQTSSQTTTLLTFCFGPKYNSSSTYSSNLHQILSNITLSTPNSPTLFSTSNSSSHSFALAQCRPDTSSQSCSTCLSHASSTLLSSACAKKSAAIRNDYCLLRYSDRRFFGTPMLTPLDGRYEVENASQPKAFERQVELLMRKVSNAAAADDSRFAVNCSERSDVYGMAWCTRDLARSDCLQCLDWGMRVLVMTKVGAEVVTVSCTLRFETYLFFSQSLLRLPSVPAGFSGDGGDGRIHSGMGELMILIA